MKENFSFNEIIQAYGEEGSTAEAYPITTSAISFREIIETNNEKPATTPTSDDDTVDLFDNGRIERREKFDVASYSTPASYHTEHTNQDALLVNREIGCFAVVDGMGGEGGDPRELATALAAILQDELTFNAHNSQELLDGMRMAFREARVKLGSRNYLDGGAVATAIKLQQIGDDFFVGIAHAGDTRLMAADPTTGEFIALTEDHGYGSTVTNGFIRGINGEKDDFNVWKVMPGTRIMLCSDGITGDWGPDNAYGRPNQFLSDREFKVAFTQNTPEESIKKFVEFSKKDDDKSIIVIDI
ncbi:MAG TPA: hypothetical protein VGE13_03945 [Candidatus Saccharimonadales bacterium]